jgi:cell division protein FtsN
MSIEEQSTMVDFKDLQAGMTVSGVGTLQHPVGEDGTGAFFAASGPAGGKLLIKLAPAGESGAAQQLDLWQRTRDLRHPHLLELRAAGSTHVAGNPYIYAVFEYPDEVLSAALAQGTLSEPETRGVVEGVLAALTYLHAQGLVHGAVTPDHIVAVGETVKLASDALRESGHPRAQGEDARQLGELVGLLRGTEPVGEPLATIARRATARKAPERWTLAQMAAALAPAPAPERRLADRGRRGGFPKWIFAGVAVLLAAIVMLNVRSKSDATPVTPAPQPAAAVTRPAPDEPPPPPKPSPVEPPVTIPTPRAAPPASANRTTAASAIWRVIAFTYRSREIAENKAKQINDRWPELHAQVFEPKSGGYYLVALGDRMEHDAAAKLQQKARSLGLPRDIYVQNYTE